MATEVQIYKDGTIVAADIATDAVIADKIAAGAVTESKIAANAVTESKIGTGSVTEVKIGAGAVTETKIATGAVTTAKIANSNVTAAKLADDVSAYLSFPLGGIVMWSGTIAQIPPGWYLCDGGTYGGIKTPDLRNRFIVGSTGNGTGTSDSPSAGPTFDATTGARSRNYTTHDIGGEDSHKLSIAELASHPHTTHFNNTSAPSNGVSYLTGSNGRNEIYISTSDPTGGDKYHENRPPYYALAYIMKCEFRTGQTQTITTTVPTLQELRLNGPLYDQEMDGGAQKGNAGDVLTSLGDGNGVRWESQANSNIVYNQNTGSSSISLTLPSGTWVVEFFFQSEIAVGVTADVYIDGVLIYTNPYTGDTQGTNNRPSFAMKTVTGGRTITCSAGDDGWAPGTRRCMVKATRIA